MYGEKTAAGDGAEQRPTHHGRDVNVMVSIFTLRMTFPSNLHMSHLCPLQELQIVNPSYDCGMPTTCTSPGVEQTPTKTVSSCTLHACGTIYPVKSQVLVCVAAVVPTLQRVLDRRERDENRRRRRGLSGSPDATFSLQHDSQGYKHHSGCNGTYDFKKGW
ncbi:hypothetical protein Bbelb_069690 [Branchiostoma belcheri]|nr:hypothetical protein Bbelb_069690 [Branchiostoma belcheri]